MSSDPVAELIELTFPASSRFVRLSRMAVATVAAELNFDVEAVDDVRIAVDELVSLLVQQAEGATVTLAFRPTQDSLSVEGHCRGRQLASIDMPDLVEAILSATTDHHQLDTSAEQRRFIFTKSRPDGAPR